MNELQKELESKQIREQAEIEREIVKDDITDMERELNLWLEWLIGNKGRFTPSQVSGCLTRARAIVSELMNTNE